MAVMERAYGTGRRKTSVARVWIKPGSGRIIVNRRAFEDYFARETLRMIIAQPFQVTSTDGQFDVAVNVGGGGPPGRRELCATASRERSPATTRSCGCPSRRPDS